MIDFSSIAAITFDCYGTLVDWETGILGVVRPLLASRGVRAEDGEILRVYAEAEARHETGAYKPYRDVLHGVMVGIGEHFGVRFEAGGCDALAASIGHWPAFGDTPGALRSLFPRFTLAVCSNIDDDLFEMTRPLLGSPLHWVVTAEYCRSYKPDPRHFRVALALMDLPPERVLHVAESLRHDIGPAKSMGMRTVWVNRHAADRGPSASGSGDATPDHEVSDMAGLMALLNVAH